MALFLHDDQPRVARGQSRTLDNGQPWIARVSHAVMSVDRPAPGRAVVRDFPWSQRTAALHLAVQLAVYICGSTNFLNTSARCKAAVLCDHGKGRTSQLPAPTRAGNAVTVQPPPAYQTVTVTVGAGCTCDAPASPPKACPPKASGQQTRTPPRLGSAARTPSRGS